MSLTHYLRAKCDNCGAETQYMPTSDTLSAERQIREHGWTTIRYDFYGNMGHYCQAAECREEARKLSYHDDSV